MASSIYCSSCGNPNPFVNCKKPNFCNSCGKSLTSNSFVSASEENKPAPITKVINHPRRRTIEVYEDEEDDVPEYIPDINKLSFQIDGTERPSVQTLEDVIFNNPIQPIKRPRRKKGNVDKDAFSKIMASAKNGTRPQDI